MEPLMKDDPKKDAKKSATKGARMSARKTAAHTRGRVGVGIKSAKADVTTESLAAMAYSGTSVLSFLALLVQKCINRHLRSHAPRAGAAGGSYSSGVWGAHAAAALSACCAAVVAALVVMRRRRVAAVADAAAAAAPTHRYGSV